MRSVLKFNCDLNNIYYESNYFLDKNYQQYNNLPPADFSEGGTLDVKQSFNKKDCIQVCTSLKTGEIFTRAYINNIWNFWHAFSNISFLSWEQGRITQTGGNTISNHHIRTPQISKNKLPKIFKLKENNTTKGLFYIFNYTSSSDNTPQIVTIQGDQSYSIDNNIEYIRIVYLWPRPNNVSSEEYFLPDDWILRAPQIENQENSQNSNNLKQISPMLTLIDDDGDNDFKNILLPIITQLQIPISSALIVKNIENSSETHLSWGEIKNLQQSGVEFLCHTYQHYLASSEEFQNIDKYSLSNDYRQAKFILEQHGISANLLIYSSSTGLYSKSYKAAQAAGFKGGILAGPLNTSMPGATNFLNDIDPFQIQRYRIGAGENSIKQGVSFYPWNSYSYINESNEEESINVQFEEFNLPEGQEVLNIDTIKLLLGEGVAQNRLKEALITLGKLSREEADELTDTALSDQIELKINELTLSEYAELTNLIKLTSITLNSGLKNLIDTLENNNGWMIWMMHTSNKNGDLIDQQVLANICLYAKVKNIDIVTATAGFNTYCE